LKTKASLYEESCLLITNLIRLEIKSSSNFPFFRRLQKSLLSHKTREQQIDTNKSKVLQRQKTSLSCTTFDDASIISVPSVLPTIDADNEHISIISVA
jgi:hypothetical protein